MDDPYAALLPVVVVAFLSPLLVGLLPARARVPQVVVLLLGGVIIGPQMLDWSSQASVVLLSDLGLGFLFLFAGYELDPAIMRQRAGRLAIGAWCTSLVVAVALVFVVAAPATSQALAAGSIALTTTALGVLLPVLRDAGQLGTRFGTAVFAVGAVGELGPIVAMALLLGSRRSGAAAVLLVVFAVVAVLLALLPTKIRLPRTEAVLLRSEHGTGQTTVRLTLVLLVALLAAAASLGFDAVLGAFLAGMILRRWAPGDVEKLEEKMDVIGWGVFIPVFFVSSGMGLDIDSIGKEPWMPFVFLALLLVVRSGPVLAWFRRALAGGERVQVALYSATTLPLLVALTKLAVDDGVMSRSVAAALVGAGVLSVLVFPIAAHRLGDRDRAALGSPPE
ncbi:transporter, CPA2 family [Sanguibacter gelidistatuariae]|uniref:Transporter, CPA2 family n=1 Tax=Sanguibacter gelidistatuariae TaxID=1814289 RepID=A0A1G6QFP4_9MICO|nr:cation:proton antiporter [Sanguibacter gelidistatuariae]SDC90981.1 transporter, CPA2 family [Sanguibacter gelidistatuariae]